jgi:hypothetical protein
MSQIDYREFYRVFAKYYHPDNPVSRISYRPAATLLGYHLGIVEDNADPDKRGRLKVRFPFWGDKVVSNWIPLLRPYASKEAGAWMLPDIGTQDIQRSLQNPRWSSARTRSGEEITLSVDLVNQHANAGVTFTVWKEGADEAKDPPLVKLKGQNKGGKAEVTWRYHFEPYTPEIRESELAVYLKERLGIEVSGEILQHYIKDYKEKYENPFDKKARFYFTAQSYRCEQINNHLQSRWFGSCAPKGCLRCCKSHKIKIFFRHSLNFFDHHHRWWLLL